MGAGPHQRAGSPASAPARQLPDFSRPRWLRHARRPGGAGILSTGLRQRGRRMERHLPRHGACPDGKRRGTNARVLAALAAPDGCRSGPGGCPMTAATVAVSRQQIEDFLYAEAALLDSWALDEWLQLFDEDAKYGGPSNDVL